MPSRTLTLTSCLALLGLVSCRSSSPPSDRDDDRAGGSPTSPRPVAPTSAATQLDLAHELDATEHTEDPLTSLYEVRDRWQGKRLTWTVTRQAVLCRTAASCNVMPFPSPRPAEVAGHGWMPRLDFAPGQFAKLVAACGATPTCEVTFEGDLAQLVVSDELPTSLRFTNVSIVTATATTTAPAAARHAGG
jgi:hypothetical protein